ncbi:GxxExxY protein [Rubritalea tangerina]|uniref:GxxExxY protein n=2 Tax=Rubritalea tangerina TaxID=430798 RepID=A0ABW4ZC93_9BACT
MEFLYKEESYKILGAIFEVYREKGCGFLEDVYQECLEIEMKSQGIPAVSKPKLELEYKGQKLRKSYEPDVICYGKIVLELKACKAIDPVHIAQLHNYLKATGMRVGYVVNFGSYPKAHYQRVVV